MYKTCWQWVFFWFDATLIMMRSLPGLRTAEGATAECSRLLGRTRYWRSRRWCHSPYSGSPCQVSGCGYNQQTFLRCGFLVFELDLKMTQWIYQYKHTWFTRNDLKAVLNNLSITSLLLLGDFLSNQYLHHNYMFDLYHS